jgi:hypothetical protein
MGLLQSLHAWRLCRENPEAPPPLFVFISAWFYAWQRPGILMDDAYAHLAACYKRTADHCIVKLNGYLSPGTWLKSSCRAGHFFQESLCVQMSL